MRVMVSLNLADIMTATRPATRQDVQETSIDEVEQTDHSQDSHSEQMKDTIELIENAAMSKP